MARTRLFKGLRAFGLVVTLVFIIAGALSVRYYVAAAAAARAWQNASVQKIHDFGATQTLEVLPLIDEVSSRPDLRSEHGVAYLVRTDRQTVLLDFGWNPSGADPSPLQHNMQRLGVGFEEVDAVVLSHLHPDHVGGLKWWLRNTFSPGSEQLELGDRRVYAPEPVSYPGLTPVVATAPRVVGAGIATTGALDFMDVWPLLLRQPRRAEQALAIYVAGRGIVLITGCGHPTLEKFVTRAQALFDVPVVGIVGGLHYEAASDEEVRPHVQYLQASRPQLVALSPHDSSAAAIAAFREAFPRDYYDIDIGQPITFTQPPLARVGKVP